METCRFCEIVKRELPQEIIYEDELCIVFPDKHPIRPGHILVIPKLHEPDYWKLPNDIYSHLMEVSHNLANVLYAVYNPPKVGMGIFGFDVHHTHIHLVPMHDGYDIVPGYVLPGKQRVTLDAEGMKETKNRISEKLKS